MKFLGFVFIIVLILAIVGYSRDWFSVSTSRAEGKSDVTIEVDGKKIGADTKAAAEGVSDLSGKAVDAIKSLKDKGAAAETELEGTLTAVDLAARKLQVTVGTKSHDVQVPTAVLITRAGESVGFDTLRPTLRVKLSFSGTGDTRTLTKIELLP